MGTVAANGKCGGGEDCHAGNCMGDEGTGDSTLVGLSAD